MEKLRVLLVDDVADMRKFIKNALQRTFIDCDVDEASDGIDARTHMETLQYDLVLCDWGLPGLTGEDLLKWVRSDEKHKEVPFIIVTGYRDRERVLRAMEFGVTDYIVKPISIDTLIKKVREANNNFIGKKAKS